MKNLQVVSAYHVVDGPWGGGNNFARALFSELSQRHGMTIRFLKEEGVSPPPADIIFMNQNSAGPGDGSRAYSIAELENIRARYPGAKILVRAINLRRHARYNTLLPYWLSFSEQATDRVIRRQLAMAGLVIFQSEYQKGIYERNAIVPRRSAVIHNGAPVLFAKAGQASPRPALDPAKPLRLLSTSVSGNPRNRPALIAMLSEFPGIEITHAGLWHDNVNPRRVRLAGKLDHREIAALMHEADYYLKLSEGDMCSNALIEALAFGLPVIYDRAGGGAAEVGAPYGVPFDAQDMPGMLSIACARHMELVEKIATHREDFLITRVADAYAEIFRAQLGRQEKAA
ncbi:MAG: glycosyltransferase [Alphaproteobacteria bacterium]